MKADLGQVYAGSRVALFGGSGFIGRWVARLLADCGADVVCFVRSVDRSADILARYGVRVPLQPLDLDRPDELSLALRRFDPHISFNLVAYGVNPSDADPNLARSVNADFPYHLAEALAEGGADWAGNRLVHVGTQYEYGAITNFHEDAEATPVTLYGKTKLAGTQRLIEFCTETGLTAVTARVFNVFGPGEGSHRLIPSLMRSAKLGEPLELTSGLQERDFCVVHDVAEGLLRLGAAPPLGGDPINLASGRLIQLRELVLEAAHQLQIAEGLLRFGARPDRSVEVLKPRVFVDRLRHLTGWLPETSLAEGLRRTVAFTQQTS